MRNIKTLPIILTIGVALASLGWLGNWAYNNYFNNNEEAPGELIVLKPEDSLETTIPNRISVKNISKNDDSAQKMIVNEDNQNNLIAETTRVIPAGKTYNGTELEINRLKSEIESLKKNKNSDAGNQVAEQKIEELEKKVDKLEDKNTTVETENKRLFAVLKKLSDDRKETEQKSKAWPVVYENKAPEIKAQAELAIKNNVSAKPAKTVSIPVVEKNTVPAATKTIPVSANSVAVETMQLSAFTITDNNREIETSQAYQADKFVGSITLKSGSFENNMGEVFLVITQPDGHILEKSTWETGTFQTTEGKKVYSCRMRFDYTTGETKRLSFSINAANYPKGSYLMQVYCHGILIGKMIKVLS